MRDEPNEEVTREETDPTLEGQEIQPEITNEEPSEAPVDWAAPASEPSSELPSPNDSPAVSEPAVDPMTPSNEDVAPVGAAIAAPVVASTIPPKKKGKKALIIGLIAAGVAALLVGGSALAYNLWYQNPDKVVSDAIVNAITAKTMSATGVLEIETDDYKLKIEASGKNTVSADSQVGVKLTYTADAMSVSVDGEAIYSADGDIYIRLNDAKALAASIEEQSDGQISFGVFGGVIEKIDSKWVKIGKEDLGDFSQEYEKSQQCFADISKQLEEDASFRRSVENETKELYQAHPFIVVGDKLGSRTINGQGSLGYKLSTDAEVADAFFTNLPDTELGSRLQGCSEDIKFEDFVSDDAKKDDSEEGSAEIWVSRFGHYITEINAKPAEGDETKGYLVINPVFNKNDAVEIPSESIPLSELKSDIEKAYEEYYTTLGDTYYDETDATMTEFN